MASQRSVRDNGSLKSRQSNEQPHSNKSNKVEQIPLTERFLEWFLFRFRWIFVIGFVLPLSLAYDGYYLVRNHIIFKLNSAPKAHDRKVAVIQKQIRDWIAGGRKQKLCTARAGFLTMSFRSPKYKRRMLGIKTDQLVDILEIDRENGTIRVEPMVTMGQVTRFLLPLGYTLPIVPEMDDLTVGGMVNGCGVESSGRKYGLFQHICLRFEVVTATGELVHAAKEGSQHQSLFYGIPWSHGTLGFVVAATLKIIPCKPYVKLAYRPVHGAQEITNALQTASTKITNEFVEGIMYTKDSAVVMTGQFADEPPKNGTVNAIGRWYKPWFFKHVESILEGGKDLIPFGNNVLYRYLLGWALPPKVSLLKLTTPGPIKRLYDRHHIIQDVLVPLRDLEQAVELFDREVGTYPIWLCPFHLPCIPGLLRNRSGAHQLFVDIGVYGNATRPQYEARETTRLLERFVREHTGAQLLYADCYMTKAEFWEMFDSSLYDWLRVTYECQQAFPDVYEKVCREARE